MKSRLLAAAAATFVAMPAIAYAVGASAAPLVVSDVAGLRAGMSDHAVHLTWSAARKDVVVLRDGKRIATLRAGSKAYDDKGATPQARHTYRVGVVGKGRSSRGVMITTPDYLVGGATRDLSPKGEVNLGGFGLGDGSVIPNDVVERGDRGTTKDERIKVRATVIDDGKQAIAIADLEMQGWFAAYQDGPYGMQDMAAAIAKAVPRLPVGHIVLASDHSHSAPDTMGVWGGPVPGYLAFVKSQVVAAVTEAYASRSYANIVAGHSDASDLIYNQSCSEALNQNKKEAYPGPELCATPGKDGMVRVLQATSPSGKHPLTYMVFAAHSTAGGGNGIHGDWPQFLSEALSKKYGGTGLAMVGALGGTQPCRTACSFTKPSNPGYNAKDRKTALVLNYGAHVVTALKHAGRVRGPVGGAQDFIREPITGPALTGLLLAGKYAGTHLLRSHEPPWVNGQTIRTVVGALRVGDVIIAATPGEGFPRIRQDIETAVGKGAREVITLGLAGDQLGYLISPAAYVPIIAAEVGINDNIIFNTSPTIGDHVACADITLVGTLG
ncbi:MAG TPA: hypothetical protein VM347_08245 [Nonomuraea sp.]|nr:hypothetical protein [Nonomuraea sp.]